jgi:hypothetical protein
MTETDGELVERLAKRHSVSPAAVVVVMTALRNGGGRMAQQLKSKLDALCTDIAAYLKQSEPAGGARSAVDEVSYRSISGSSDWWPSGLGRPGAVGAQNDLRYAVFPETRRLVLDDHGTISIFDTRDHRIFGVAQAQSSDQTLSFTSQDGLVRVADLQKVAH